MQVFQNVKGAAKPYQVDQLLDAIDSIEALYPDFKRE